MPGRSGDLVADHGLGHAAGLGDALDVVWGVVDARTKGAAVEFVLCLVDLLSDLEGFPSLFCHFDALDVRVWVFVETEGGLDVFVSPGVESRGKGEFVVDFLGDGSGGDLAFCDALEEVTAGHFVCCAWLAGPGFARDLWLEGAVWVCGSWVVVHGHGA